MSNVLKYENRLVRALSGPSAVPLPDGLQPFHLASPAERRRRCRFVLANAFLRWRRGSISLVDAVRAEAGSEPSGEYALREMRMCLAELNLTAWEAHPFRLRADVRSLFRRTIARVSPHRGGWHVHRPTPPRSA